MNRSFESETELTDNVVDNLELDEGLQQQVHQLDSVEDESLKVQNLQRQLDRRDATVEELERSAEAAFNKLLKIRDVVEEREESDEFTRDYESDSIEAGDYDRLKALVERYEDMVAGLVIERAILLDTVDELRQMIDEQQLRHDEKFIVEQVKSMQENYREDIRDREEFFREQLQDLVGRIDTRIDTEAVAAEVLQQIDEVDGGDGSSGVVECPAEDCDYTAESREGVVGHLNKHPNVSADRIRA